MRKYLIFKIFGNKLFGNGRFGETANNSCANERRNITVFGANKTSESDIREIRQVCGRKRSEEFWNARGRFYGKVFALSEGKSI